MKRVMNIFVVVCFVFSMLTPAWGLNVVDTVLNDVWDSTGNSLRISYVSSESGWDVADETALTNTVHPLVTFTHTTSGTPANNIGLSLDWYQETASSNTELGARMAIVATDTTSASEDFKIDWMLMAAGAAPATKLSLGSTGIMTLVGGATIDNATSATNLNITETTVTITGNEVVTGSVDITGAGGLILENDETITNSVNGTVLVTATTLATSGAIDVTGGGVTLENDATLTNAVNGTVVLTEPAIELIGDTSTTIDSPIIAAIQGTTGGWSIRSYEATTGALSGASGSCAVNVPAGALLIGTQLRVDTAITSGDGATSWKATYATGSTAAVTTGQSFNKDTKVNAFFDANAATAIMAGTLTITIEPNSNTFSGGVVRCISYAQVFTAMGNAP